MIRMLLMLMLPIGQGCKPNDAPQTETDTDTDDHHHPIDTGLQSFTVTGVVTDDDGFPVENALVQVGGDDNSRVFTDSNGEFALWFSETGLGEPAIVAAKQGYRAIGYEYFEPDTPISLVLREVSTTDNIEYVYEDPGDGIDNMREDCSHCHTTFVSEFLTSKHAEATKNPLLQDLYAGISRAHTDAESCASLANLSQGAAHGQPSTGNVTSNPSIC